MKVKLWLIASVTLILLTTLLLSACGKTTPATSVPGTTTSQPSITPSAGQTASTTPAASPTTPVPQPKYGGTLTLAEPIYPGQPLGYPPEGRGAAVLFQQPCLEALLTRDISGKFHPRLATKWEIAPDGRSVTFTLRQGVKFHDGTDFNSQAVKWNYDLQMPTGKSSSINWQSVEIIDPYTVRVNLKKWTNYALSDFSAEGGNWIVSPTAFEKNGIEWMRDNMVGTGPFKQVKIERDVQVIYEKNKDYWNKGRPYVDRIIYKKVADPMTQVAALKNKELDGMASGADSRLADLVKSGLMAVTATLGIGGYFPDSINPDSPLSKQLVREALEHAIDKQAIAKALSFGFWGPAYQYAPSTSTAYDPALPKREYDLAKAKRLLEQAGYPDGFQMNFLVTGDEPGKSVAVAVQAAWLAIGVKANLQALESAKFEEYSRTGWKQGVLYAAPTGASDWIRAINATSDPASSTYISMARTPEFIRLFNAAAESFERDQAKERAVIKYIYDTAMNLPVWEVVRAWIVQPYVKDGGFLSQSSAFYWNADTIWLDK